jgi:hypothetical protein
VVYLAAGTLLVVGMSLFVRRDIARMQDGL